MFVEGTLVLSTLRVYEVTVNLSSCLLTKRRNISFMPNLVCVENIRITKMKRREYFSWEFGKGTLVNRHF